jgi:tRNA threonylcarbamoyladenosine biosynthesis protein TsaE
MNSLQVTTYEVEATRTCGRILANNANGGEVVGVDGVLGAGKTQLAKGIGAGLGVDARMVNSPTYVIVNEHAGRIPLFHFDAYRLAGAAALADIGFEEMCSRQGIVVVEWAERVHNALPDDHLHITMTVVGDAVRTLTMNATGSCAAAFLARCAPELETLRNA